MKKLKTTSPPRGQGGFTLIELVIVIVILGILSAFALPRFMDMSTDARKSAVLGLAGAIKSAASIAHAGQIAAGGTLGASVRMDGPTVTMVNGFPTANAAGIGVAAHIDAGDFTVATGGATGGTTVDITKVGAPTPANCKVTYKAATAATDNTPPITAEYTVTMTTSGC